MLPVCPPGGGNSPYDSPSAFAGNPLFIALEPLAEQGLLSRRDLSQKSLAHRTRAAYRETARLKGPLLRKAFQTLVASNTQGTLDRLDAYAHENQSWLLDYCLYVALKRAHGGAPWFTWEPALRQRRRAALDRARAALAEEIRFQQYLQWEFERQWSALHAHCHSLGVSLLGDVPMYVRHDGADTWSNQELFDLDERGRRRTLAGVPPDYFSARGQLWGNPIYRWDVHEKTGYAWWIRRLARQLKHFDAVRIDHFIGLHRCWQVRAGARDARRGRFLYVPGDDLLSRAARELGGLPFIAEDLGTVTPEVHALRDKFALPGMRVLAFAFCDEVSDYQPHRYSRRTVVYTGTHDNDTVMGWLRSGDRLSEGRAKRAALAERDRFLRYTGSDGKEPHWDMIRLALMSVAYLAIIPMQDVLGLGSEARMNVPGTPRGNWEWRLSSSDLSLATADRLADLCRAYERIPDPRPALESPPT
jgi:4-alpha-glucanotransferase